MLKVIFWQVITVNFQYNAVEDWNFPKGSDKMSST